MATASDLISTLAKVAVRRLRSGARHPDWSLPYEVGVQLCGGEVQPERIITPAGRKRQAGMPIPPGLRRRLAFERTTLAELPSEQHTPRDWDAATGQTFLYIHGGGYFACSAGTHRALIARIAAASNARCIAPNYRLAPEHPFPAAIDDCVAAYRALLQDGVSPERLFVGGDSAGGGLTLALLQRLRDAGEALPRGVVLLSPWVDLEAQDGSMQTNAAYDYLPSGPLHDIVKQYVGDQDMAHPLISPIHADLHGLPPTLMLTGALELFLDQDLAFADRARAHGVDLQHVVEDGMVHVYPLLADISKPARHAFQRIADFMRAGA